MHYVGYSCSAQEIKLEWLSVTLSSLTLPYLMANGKDLKLATNL